jgi:hypothetical protein
VPVIHGSGKHATTGRFIAPLPTDRRAAMPVIPLARRASPKAARSKVALSSHYYSPRPVRISPT